MTMIVAAKFWRALAVIADCRVSYVPLYEEVDDYLQKLYRIGDRLVLGFAGPLQGAYEILKLVRKNTYSYSKPPIASNLQADVERWIRYKYRSLDEADRKNLGFIIATVEPKREKRSEWFSSDSTGERKPMEKPGWFPYVPEWKILTLKPSQSKPAELTRDENRLFQNVGLGDKDWQAIRQTMMRSYRFSFQQPVLQMQTLMGFLKFELMARQVRKIGGLFQCALLSENGIQWLGYSGKNVSLELIDARFVQRNTATGEVIPLMTIWEWAEQRPPPGSFGAFEDPGLQQAIENLRENDD